MGIVLTLLCSLLILVVICGAVYWVGGLFGIPAKFIQAICGLLGLIWIVYAISIFIGYAPPFFPGDYHRYR